jgi:hypothetical protein
MPAKKKENLKTFLRKIQRLLPVDKGSLGLLKLLIEDASVLDDECYKLIFECKDIKVTKAIFDPTIENLRLAHSYCGAKSSEHIGYFLNNNIKPDIECLHNACKVSPGYIRILIENYKIKPNLNTLKQIIINGHVFDNISEMDEEFQEIDIFAYVFNKLDKLKIHADKECLDLLCNGSTDLPNFAVMLMQTVTPTYENLISCCKNKLHGIIEKLFNYGVKPDKASFIQYLNVSVPKENTIQAFTNNGIIPDDECLKLFINNLKKFYFDGGGKGLVKLFVEGGLELTNKCYQYVCDAYEMHKGNYSEVIKYFLRQNIKPADNQILGILQASKGNYTQSLLLNIIGEMRRLGVIMPQQVVEYLMNLRDDEVNQFLVVNKYLDLQQQLEMECFVPRNTKKIKELMGQGGQINIKCVRNACTNANNLMMIKFLIDKGGIDPDIDCLKNIIAVNGDRTMKYLIGFI